MPSTRSRAATKCISEVPGLAKHTSTPPPTRVRTRLSAPFICSAIAPSSASAGRILPGGGTGGKSHRRQDRRRASSRLRRVASRQRCPGRATLTQAQRSEGSSMKYDVISADCHVDLIWLPPDLFTASAPAALKERMPYVTDGRRGKEWVTKNGSSFGLMNGMGSAGRLYEPGKIHR